MPVLSTPSPRGPYNTPFSQATREIEASESSPSDRSNGIDHDFDALLRSATERAVAGADENQVADSGNDDRPDGTESLHDSVLEDSKTHYLRPRDRDFTPYTDAKRKSTRQFSKAKAPRTRKRGSTADSRDSETLSENENVASARSRKQPKRHASTAKAVKLSREEMKDRTRLMVTIQDGDEDLCIPIYLSTCDTISKLYDKIVEVSDVPETKVKFIKITFPWLSNQKPLVVRRELDGCYRMIEDEMERAPCWAEDEKICEIIVMVIEREG